MNSLYNSMAENGEKYYTTNKNKKQAGMMQSVSSVTLISELPGNQKNKGNKISCKICKNGSKRI